LIFEEVSCLAFELGVFCKARLVSDFITEGIEIKENQVMSAVGVCVTSKNQAEYQGALRARCEMSGGGRDCRVLTLTARRAFVESFVPLVTGSKVNLNFRLPNGHQVCSAGVVSQHEFAVGFAVDFTELSPLDYEQIVNLVG
jgi:hypothetical protein